MAVMFRDSVPSSRQRVHIFFHIRWPGPLHCQAQNPRKGTLCTRELASHSLSPSSHTPFGVSLVKRRHPSSRKFKHLRHVIPSLSRVRVSASRRKPRTRVRKCGAITSHVYVPGIVAEKGAREKGGEKASRACACERASERRQGSKRPASNPHPAHSPPEEDRE